jgi:hypothetical protein
MINLSVDELRVAAAVIGAAVPAVVDQYATAEAGADAAAARSLVARNLAGPGAGEPLAIEPAAVLVDALAALCAPHTVVELELAVGRAATLRFAEVRADVGQLRTLRESSPDVWRIDDQPAIAAAVAVDQPAASGSGRAVELGLAEQTKLDELLAEERDDDVRALLGADATDLAEALTDGTRVLGRLTRVWRVGDGIAVDRFGWVSAPCGAWLIDDADPDSERLVTTFTPVEPADVTAEIDYFVTGERP